MNGSNKRFSTGWIIGIALGLGTGAVLVQAAVTLETFTAGTPASAASVNANFQALKDAIDGCPTDMLRVGSTCVDKEAQTATAAAACKPTGEGCTATTLTVSAGAPSTALSWGQAVAACTNAGKRLATSREILTASHSGAITVADGTFLYVDAAAARAPAPGSTVLPEVAGTHLLKETGLFKLLGTNTAYTETFTTVGFRCAR